MRITKKQLRHIIREGIQDTYRILAEEASAPDPRDWKPHPLLPSSTSFGADMETGGVLSSFKTDFGTYFHEPADDDAIWFEPKKNPRNVATLGQGTFNNAKAIAIDHHEKLLSPPTQPTKDYKNQLATAVHRARTKPKIQRPPGGIGPQAAGWMEFPNGRIVQFSLRGSQPLSLVMEAMGTEEEEEAGTAPYAEDNIAITTTGDLKKDTATVVGHILAFVKKHRSIVGPNEL